jgi:predicted patatin/cPLA2 family phospholipase
MLKWRDIRKPRKTSPKEIDLVLGSSGTRAPCFVGAIDAILEKGYHIRRIAGFSGGAIIAAGYALGMSIEDLKEAAERTPYKDFRDFRIKNLFSLSNPSVYTGEPLDAFYQRLFGDATLKDFKIDCRIGVVTIIGRKRVILTKETHPDLPVWKAVRMSSTIPFIFPYMELDGVAVTDGALVTNMFDIFPEGERTMVTLCPRADQGLRKVVQSVKANHLFLWNYLKILAEYFLDAVDNRHIPQEEWGRTILIPTFELGGFNFEIGPQDITRLIQYGYNAVIISDVLPSVD